MNAAVARPVQVEVSRALQVPGEGAVGAVARPGLLLLQATHLPGIMKLVAYKNKREASGKDMQ